MEMRVPIGECIAAPEICDIRLILTDMLAVLGCCTAQVGGGASLSAGVPRLLVATRSIDHLAPRAQATSASVSNVAFCRPFRSFDTHERLFPILRANSFAGILALSR